MTRRLVCLCTLLLAYPAVAFGYLQLSIDVNGQSTRLRWPPAAPVRWYASDRSMPGVSASAFQSTVARAFQTWQDVPTASVSFAFAGFTSARPFDEDGLSVLGFEDEPEMDRVLGATSFVVDDVTGEIVESDIFFNSAFRWSTAGAGEPGAFDLQSVATHEIGHFAGLGHSAIGETELRPSGGRRVLASGAVMFPIAFGPGNVVDRQLQPDDIAGVSDLYPDAGFRDRTGAVRGRVLLDGRPVFGAHVVAFDLVTGDAIGGFTLNENGEFQIAGLRPGSQIIRVEPLDDADIDSFFDADGVALDFRPTFHPRLVAAPAGGVAAHFDVGVTPK